MRKMGDKEISNRFDIKLGEELKTFQLETIGVLDSYIRCLNQYSQKMQDSLDEVKYLSSGDLLNLHQITKNAIISEVQKLVFILQLFQFKP